MDKASGLGRGLGSLISNKNKITSSTNLTALAGGTGERVIDLEVEKISPNPDQPRSHFDEKSLKELMNSIRDHGVIQPIIVSPLDDQWQLIAGERRLRAVKGLGQKTIPAIVRDLNEQKRLEIALIENLQREDLNALETATAYGRLMDEFNLTPTELGKKVGKSRPTVVNTMRILNVEDQVKEAIINGEISDTHARALAGLPPAEQLALLDKIINLGMNAKETEEASREIVATKKIRTLKRIDPEIISKTEYLQKTLGTKVEIKKKSDTGAGQIVIKFFSDEEFNDLMKKF